MEAWLLAAGLIGLLVILHKRGGGSYKDYLRSSVWQKKRVQALRRDKFRCRVCNSRVCLEVHHRCYPAVLGTESVDDLTTLCHDCHSLFSRAR